MHKYIHKIVEYGLYLFVFLLPWQTRWIWHQGWLGSQPWEYGTFSLYGTDILFLAILLLSLFLHKNITKGTERFWVIVGAFFLVCFVSILTAQNKELSWYAAVKLAEGLLVGWLIIRGPINWPILGVTLVSSGVVQAVLGTGQFFSQRVLAAKWLGLAAHDPATPGDFVVATGAGRFLRAYGAFPHPNILGGFLVVCLLVLVGLIFYLHRRRLVRWWTAVLYTLSFAIMTPGLIFTFSRSAWLAFGAALLGMFIFLIWYRDSWRLMILGRLCLWLALLVMTTVAMFPFIWQTRLTGAGQLEARSVTERVGYYAQARDLMADNWRQGVGLGNYTQAVYNNDPSHEAWYYQPVHNIFVLVATETGLFGGLLFLLVVFEFMRATIKVLAKEKRHVSDWFMVFSAAFLALLLIGLFDHYLWSLSFGILLFWLVFGLWAKQWAEYSSRSMFNSLVDKLLHRQA
jgi:hypothetical protein